jgi:hypothetical protein
MLPVFVQGGGSYALQLSAGQGRLQDVGSINGALRSTRPDQRVHLINHEDDVIGCLDLLHQLLQPLLKLSSVLCSGNQQPHVQGDDLLALNSLGDITRGNPLGQTLGDGRLSDTGLSNEAGVVLGTPTEDLSDALNLWLPANNRVELALQK